LSTTIGGLVKIAKSKLFDILEDEAGNSEDDMGAFNNNAIIVDGMAVVQSIKGK
jgi:hypothetical protein